MQRKQQRNFLVAVGITIIVVCLNSRVLAQSTVGQISGSVKDQAGAALPGATITVTNDAIGLTRTATTNDDGFYVVTNLPPGSYAVAGERQSFKRAVQSGNALVADGRLTVDFSMEPGEVTETVEVTSVVGEAVNTTSGEVARVVDREQVQNLALNGRNYIQLTTLIPGAPLTNFDPVEQTTSSNAGQSINGSRPNTNNLTVDGSFNLNKSNNNEQNHNVGIDFIQEVKIQTSNFSAEYGRQSGAAINVVTRAGGNQYTGSLFEYFRNEVLDARSFFAPRRNRLRFNDFGYSFGGPIIKDKFFFFGGQEWKYVRRDSNVLRRSIPTRAERAGNFSNARLQANGTPQALNVPAGYTAINPATGATVPAGQPIPGRNLANLRRNNQPVALSADGRAIAAVYNRAESEAGSYSDAPVANNAVYQLPQPFDFRQDILRLDYRFNERHNVFARYLHDINTLDNPFGISAGSELPTIPSQRTRPAHGIQLSYTWLIKPTLINEAKFTYSNLDLAVTALGDAYLRSTYGFAYPQLYNDGTYANGIPDVTINGFAGFNGPSALQTSLFVDRAVSDNLTIIRGNHTIKTGGLFFRATNDQNGVVTSVYTGAVTFNPAGNPNSTGNAFADALLGNYRNYGEIQRPIPTYFITDQFETYVTDSWKAHPRFSLEYGARYHHIKPLYARADNLTNFDPAAYDLARALTLRPAGTIDLSRGGNRFNGLIRAGDGDQVEGFPAEVPTVPGGAVRSLQPIVNVFAPRLSFAYSPFADNRTAVRGGFGVFFDSVQGDLTQRIAQNPPYTDLAQFENGNLSTLSLNAAAPAPFGTIVAVDPNLKTPYTMNFSLSVQRELPRGFFVETAYVGNLGRHLLRRPDVNQPTFAVLAANNALPAAQRSVVNALRPYKGFSQILMSLSDANSNYNAWQLYVAKRAGDLRLTGSYTFSKALTDASGSADNPEEPFNRRFNYGPATYNRPHVFVSTFTYGVRPRDSFGSVGRVLLGGWEVSGITRFQSGADLTVTGNTALGTRRADYIGGPVLLPDGERGPNRWLNVAAFDEAPDARRGNAGVGTVRGPGLQVWDISLRRRFNLREDVSVQFQADLFNAFNRANFLNLSLNVTNADFGSITSSAPGRNIQFGLKLNF